MSYLLIEDFNLKKFTSNARTASKDAKKENKLEDKKDYKGLLNYKRKSKDSSLVTASKLHKRELEEGTRRTKNLVEKESNRDRGNNPDIIRLKNEKGLPVKNY